MRRWLGRGVCSQPPQALSRDDADRPYSPGEVLYGGHVVRRRLGQGGMGDVYLVEHVSSSELRAAKVMRARSTASAANLVAFRQEALALLNVGAHPFFVRLLEVHEHARDTVLMMEYVAPRCGCTTVHDYITRTQDYTDSLLAVWAVQFCVGMEHALRCGMTAHRDIKPGNLLVGSGAFIKIADFGLALAASRYPEIVRETPKEPLLLQELQSEEGHRICGTPGYIAPELFGGANASAQSDMFSLGVTLWQLAARSMVSPYDISFRGEVAEYQRAILAKALTHKVRAINSPFRDVIHRCLAPDPARRYPDFPALREAIKSAAKAADIRAVDFIVAAGFRGRLEDYVNRGRAYLVLGRHERALRILDEAVKYKPDCAAALLARAEALSFRGQLIRAMHDYGAAHRLEPEADAPLIGVASTSLELGRPGSALRALEIVLERHPNNLDALLLKARTLSEQGQEQSALDAIAKILEADPGNARAHEYRGRVLWRIGKLDEAATAFARCMQINPLALDARLALASLLTGQGAFAEAEAQYEEARLQSHRDSEALNEIAAHMAEHGHAKKAIGLFFSLAEMIPDSRSTMLVNIGNAHLQLGSRASAVSFFEQAIKANEGNALAYQRLGDLVDEDGRYDMAATYFAKACELDSENWSHHACAGTAYLRSGNLGRARSHLRRSVDLFPEQPLTLYNLAAAIAAEGEPEAAVEELAKAVRIDEDYARGWYLKAQIEARLGRVLDATASALCAMTKNSSLSAEEVRGLRVLLQQFRSA